MKGFWSHLGTILGDETALQLRIRSIIYRLLKRAKLNFQKTHFGYISMVLLEKYSLYSDQNEDVFQLKIDVKYSKHFGMNYFNRADI